MSILGRVLQSSSEENSLPFDIGSAADKEIAQLTGPILAVRKWIERQINFAVVREARLQIAKKKIPFTRPPALTAVAVSIKADRESGDPVELLVESWQGFERFDSENCARHREGFNQFAKERRLIDVETEHGMIESFEDEQKETAAAAEIEHAPRRSSMQFQILNALAIDAQPVIDVSVLRIARTGVTRLNFGESILIDARQDRAER